MGKESFNKLFDTIDDYLRIVDLFFELPQALYMCYNCFGQVKTNDHTYCTLCEEPFHYYCELFNSYNQNMLQSLCANCYFKNIIKSFKCGNNCEIQCLKNELSTIKKSADKEIKELRTKIGSIKGEVNQFQLIFESIKSVPFNIDDSSKVRLHRNISIFKVTTFTIKYPYFLQSTSFIFHS